MKNWADFKTYNLSCKHYLEDGGMLQSAVNLHLICHTLDHASFVHRFLVDLQMEVTQIITPLLKRINMHYGTELCFSLGANSQSVTQQHLTNWGASLWDQEKPRGGN